MSRTALFLLLGTTLLASACGSSADGAAKPASASKPGTTVEMSLLSFKPQSTTVKAGQTVTWVNDNDIGHVLVEGTYQVGDDSLRTSETDDKAFNLVVSKKGDKVAHTYDKAGSYTYYCSVHKGMNGTVVVQ